MCRQIGTFTACREQAMTLRLMRQVITRLPIPPAKAKSKALLHCKHSPWQGVAL